MGSEVTDDYNGKRDMGLPVLMLIDDVTIEAVPH